MAISKYLLAKVKQDTPELNPDIANGLVGKYMRYVVEYIDKVWKVAAKDFPKGLTYEGCTRCTPYEEYLCDKRKKDSKKVVDTSRSDIYLMRYDFKFNGNPLPPKYIYLPFVRDAASIVLSGSTFFISPILSDVVLSFEQDNVFVKLLRDKFKIERVVHNVVVGERIQPYSVVWANTYHMSPSKRPTNMLYKANMSLMHFLLCRYGFTQSFKVFGNCSPVVVDGPIDTEMYPPKDWVVFKSTGYKPKTISNKLDYTPSQIRVAVRKTELSPMVQSMIAGFFYIVDHFPSRVKVEYLDNTRLWKTLLGHLIFGSKPSEGKLHDDADDHIQSLQEYIDQIMKARFKSIGIEVDSIFEFFAIAIRDFNDWIIAAKTKANSLYDKELSVLLDMLMPITMNIFKLLFKLRSANKGGLTEKEVINAFNKTLTQKVIFNLTKQTNGVSSMSYSGDNKCMKITTTIVPQKNTNGRSKEAQSLNDPTKRLHVSFSEVGGFIHLTESNITGENKINPHIRLTSENKIIRNEDLRAVLDNVQTMIQRD